MDRLVKIDGASGEGGGQILRSALSLSIRTGQAFHIRGIRAGRSKPGLMRQHLACVQAASVVCGGSADGAQVGSTELLFQPGPIQGGNYRFDIGSAGSTMLVLQTVLLNLLDAPKPSTLRIEGGTHGKTAPSTDFIAHSYFPMLQKMGANLQLCVRQAGFYPMGGGVVEVDVQPGALTGFALTQRGDLLSQEATAFSCGVPGHVATRELEVLAQELRLRPDQLRATRATAQLGRGNSLHLCLQFPEHQIAISALGERGLSAEAVANQLVQDAKSFLAQSAPIDAHLADQLLLPLVWAGGGCFRCEQATAHLYSNAEVIEAFAAARVSISAQADGSSLVSVNRSAAELKSGAEIAT